MAEIKSAFNQGKMNKDLDERIIPNGQYRDALNIQVSTSEGSDVGTVQNILGNALLNTDVNGTTVVGIVLVPLRMKKMINYIGLLLIHLVMRYLNMIVKLTM